MADLPAVPSSRIPATGPAALAGVRRLEGDILRLPQIPIATRHLLHAGMYARTITVPPGIVFTSALVRLATIMVFDGDALVSLDGDSVRLTGRHVLPASAARKQAFITIAETHITMLFPTSARTVEEAEAAFTEEAAGLASRRDANHVVITGE